ncbi:MAG: agmatine deiminase family protein [Bacteroidia bacterium]
MVAWTSFTSIIREIVRAAQSETQVIILCTDSNAVKTSLTSASIPLTNVQYLEVPFNTIWSRDYGQWNIYTNDVDSLALIDAGFIIDLVRAMILFRDPSKDSPDYQCTA